MITSKRGIECIKRDLSKATEHVKKQSLTKKLGLTFFGVSDALKDILELVDKHEKDINKTEVKFKTYN